MHLSLLASERFYSNQNRWPGAGVDDDVSADARLVEQEVLGIVKCILPKYSGVPDEIVESVSEV